MKVVLGLLFLGLLCLTEGQWLVTLPPEEVEAFHEKLRKEKPHLMKSPNDVALPEENLRGLESSHHHPKLEDNKNLVDLAESLNLTILVKALEQTGLDNIIDHEGKFTLFAPTDDAFRNIPKWAQKLPLKEVLRFHVARGLVYDKDIKNEMLVRSLLSKRDIRLNVYKKGSVMTANGSPLISANYEAHNGVLHMIDKVMVHIFPRDGSVIKELARCPVFKTLAKLIKLAKLEDALHGKGPFTLFAPSDSVFEKLPADFVKHLVDNPTALRQVLLYHVAVGTWYSAGLEDGMTLKTLQETPLNITVSSGGVGINGKVGVTYPDATASNGVIHSVDGLLIPPMLEKEFEKFFAKSHLKGQNRD